MEKNLFSVCIMVFIVNAFAFAQITEKLSSKVTLSVNTNIETYFIAG